MITKAQALKLGSHPDFDLLERATGLYWMHKTEPVWIVHYDAVEDGRREFFQAYRAIQKAKKGAERWAVDNRRVGTDRGFATLQEAFKAANEQQKTDRQVA